MSWVGDVGGPNRVGVFDGRDACLDRRTRVEGIAGRGEPSLACFVDDREQGVLLHPEADADHAGTPRLQLLDLPARPLNIVIVADQLAGRVDPWAVQLSFCDGVPLGQRPVHGAPTPVDIARDPVADE